MEVPEAKWLKPYSWSIIVISAIETFMVSPGSILAKAAFTALSSLTVVIGFIIICVIVDSYVRWLKLTQIIIERKHRQNIEDIAILSFYFGAIGSSILVIIYPIMGVQILSFSMAPMGVGFLQGAKWISTRYNPLHTSAYNNVTYLNKKDYT